MTTITKFPADIIRLDNGLTVIHQYLPATPVAVVDVWVKAGAIAEPDVWSGMAHFLEHMIFKGTEQIAPGVFDQIIENCGGMTNAATSHDYAHFFITTAAQYLDEALPPLAELLLNASVPEDEFARERDVVLEEIRQAYDNPDWLAFQALVESVYPRHPYGRPVLGTEAKLMQQGPEDMRCFHACHYQPDNMCVAIVGGIPLNQALDIASSSFAQFAPKKEYLCPEAEAEPPMTEIRRRELYLPRLEQSRLMMAWMGPGVVDSPVRDAYGLDIISVLLGEGRLSRLVRHLREELHLVQGISCDFSLQRESSLFTITAWLEPQHLERVEALICDRLGELQTKLVSEIELARCKRLLCNDYAFSTETPSQLAGLYGYYYTLSEAEIAVTYPQQIQSFEPEDIQRLASVYLSPNYYAVTTLKPL